MYRYIVTSSDIDLPKIQNSIAKSLKKKLDGFYKLEKSSNMCEISSTILYQIPKRVSDRYNLPDDVKNNVNEMDVTITVKCYSNKIAVSIVEHTPEEKTIAFKSFKESAFINVQLGCKQVYDFIRNSIELEFSAYEVLF